MNNVSKRPLTLSIINNVKEHGGRLWDGLAVLAGFNFPTVGKLPSDLISKFHGKKGF
jgi:hypothetical protein